MGSGGVNGKKRKCEAEAKQAKAQASASGFQDGQTAMKGRSWTISVAIPGSVITDAQCHELRVFIAWQIARALSIFCVDEVVIFDDGSQQIPRKHHRNVSPSLQADGSYTGTSDPCHFLAHILNYFETPPALRRYFFPLHSNLKGVGILPALDLPHHLNQHDWSIYREGATLDKPDGISIEDGWTLVDAGLGSHVKLEGDIPPNTRVTLKLEPELEDLSEPHIITAEAVNPDEPREEGGYYWGYTIRRARNISNVFTECTYADGYDVSVGVSPDGLPMESLYCGSEEERAPTSFKHMVLVLGGRGGLEEAVNKDADFQELGVTRAKEVFDRWIDVCPGHGTQSLRPEETLWIGLAGLKRMIPGQE